MASTHDLIAGRCGCGAPVRLFCTRCGYMYHDQNHLKTCEDREAKPIFICQCMNPEVMWGIRPRRRVRPHTDETTLFPLPPRAVE